MEEHFCQGKALSNPAEKDSPVRFHRSVPGVGAKAREDCEGASAYLPHLNIIGSDVQQPGSHVWVGT